MTPLDITVRHAVSKDEHLVLALSAPFVLRYLGTSDDALAMKMPPCDAGD